LKEKQEQRKKYKATPLQGESRATPLQGDE